MGARQSFLGAFSPSGVDGVATKMSLVLLSGHKEVEEKKPYKRARLICGKPKWHTREIWVNNHVVSFCTKENQRLCY
jgi:hypothetical protein